MSDAESMMQEEVPEGSEALPEEGVSTPEQAETATLEDAFQQAEAALRERDEEQAKPEPRPQEAQQPGKQQSTPKAQKAPSVEAELDRLITAVQRGAIENLPAPLRGRLAALERELGQRLQQQQQAEAQARQQYLKLEALRIEDPDEFVRLMFEDENAQQNRSFYEAAKSAFGEIDPDTGDVMQQADPQKVRSETLVEVFSDMLSAVSEATGLQGAELDSVKSQSAGPWDFLQRAIKFAVEREVQKERQKIAAEEAKAAKAEAQAQFIANGVVVPKDLPSYTAAAAESGPLTLRQAAELAERMLGR